MTAYAWYPENKRRGFSLSRWSSPKSVEDVSSSVPFTLKQTERINQLKVAEQKRPTLDISDSLFVNTHFMSNPYNQTMTNAELSALFSIYTPFLSAFTSMLGAGNVAQQQMTALIYKVFFSRFSLLDDIDLQTLRKFPSNSYIGADNAVTIEWNINKIILAFDIEENIEDSCWSLSSTPDAGNYSMSGSLSEFSVVESVAERLTELIISQLRHIL